MLRRLARRDPNLFLQALGPRFDRETTLDRMPWDLEPSPGRIEFQQLSGLFASTSFDHAVIAMTVRQAAYLFGLVRGLKPRRIVEIGRYKGGSTLVVAAAMPTDARFWSIDIGEKEGRLARADMRPYDRQLSTLLDRLSLTVELVVADSRTVDIDTGELDLVLIDGDHTYDGVKSDFERFGRRARVGGAVLFDDTFDEKLFRTHSDTVGRLVREILEEGEFRLVKAVDRLAHLERVRAR